MHYNLGRGQAKLHVLKLTSVFHHLPSVGPEQLCAIAHLVRPNKSDTSYIMKFQVGEPIAPSYIMNVGIINILWTISCGRRLHVQQQEFQSVYECIEKITQFMSKAAIMSFMPFLSRLLPESISKMEKGRYFRDRFVAISEVNNQTYWVTSILNTSQKLIFLLFRYLLSTFQLLMQPEKFQ